jgi:hypothetical protein
MEENIADVEDICVEDILLQQVLPLMLHHFPDQPLNRITGLVVELEDAEEKEAELESTTDINYIFKII